MQNYFFNSVFFQHFRQSLKRDACIVANAQMRPLVVKKLWLKYKYCELTDF